MAAHTHFSGAGISRFYSGFRFKSMSYARFLLASVFTCVMATTAQAQESLTPQQVTELFFKTLLQADPAAMKALNAYLQPARDASGNKGPFVNVEEMLKADASFADELATQVMEQVNLNEKQKAALKPNVVTWLQAVRDAQKRTSCTFGAVKPVTEGVYPGYKTVTVDFDCKVVNPRDKVNTVLERARAEGWNSLYQYQQGFTAAARGFQSATLTQKFSGKFPLTSKLDVTIWQNQFPRETVDVSDFLY